MRNGIFVTGGSGFVGTALLPALRATGRPVIALTRKQTPALAASGATTIAGDLLNPDTYRHALRSCDVVIHLAAATGRASAAEHERVNAEGTARLVEACRKAGVEKLLFVSTIAATFPDVTGYHYAEAKLQAEAGVAGSGLRFTIVRPAIILGAGAPILRSLETLALLPVILVPGSGRIRVQPVDVRDVARCLAGIVERDRFAGETFNLGGPDTITMEALLRRIRVARTGRAGPVLHLPLALLSVPLRAAEALGLGRLLPLTAGQLSSFRFDGVADNAPYDYLPDEPAGLDEMIGDKRSNQSDTNDRTGAECRVFARHLLGCDPDSYVAGKYASACASLPALAPEGRFDRWLLGFAAGGALRVRMADAYASVFFRRSALRKRLVLLLAVLETSRQFHAAVDQVPPGSRSRLLVSLAISTVGSLLSLLAGLVVLLPVRAGLALTTRDVR